MHQLTGIRASHVHRGAPLPTGHTCLRCHEPVAPTKPPAPGLDLLCFDCVLELRPEHPDPTMNYSGLEWARPGAGGRAASQRLNGHRPWTWTWRPPVSPAEEELPGDLK